MPIVTKNPKSKPANKPTDELLKASYSAGLATGRIEAIEESMDTLAGLIFKAEALAAKLGENSELAIRDNANHTLRALHIAFAAVTDSVNGSPAFHALLEQSRERLLKKAAAMH